MSSNTDDRVSPAVSEQLNGIIRDAFGPYGLTEQSIQAVGMMLDNRYEGLIVVDAEGRVVYMNRENEKYLGLARGAAKGRPIQELIPSSRLHIVCKTGKAEVGQLQEIKGRMKVSARVPLVKEGRVIGAVGSIMFRDVAEVNKLARMVRVLEHRVADYQKQLRELPQRNRYTFDQILGSGPRLRETVALARRIAESDVDVLIAGETGTGKELFAHAIHTASPRGDGPFVRLNCAAIPKDLAESELFGYVPGAFSGANRKGKIGKFEQAHGGTIFLDEIGDLPLEIQAKLLRVLQEREVERVGGSGPRLVDFRLIAASNIDLKEHTDAGRFRLDLYFRLHRMLLSVPALRDHAEDIPEYVRHFLGTLPDAGKGGSPDISPQALEALCRYSWPGNVRELTHVVERVAWESKGRRIEVSDLPPSILMGAEQAPAGAGTTLLKEAVEQAEKTVIRRVLELTGNNKSQACKLLDIHRTTLYQKLAKYGLE